MRKHAPPGQHSMWVDASGACIEPKQLRACNMALQEVCEVRGGASGA